MDAAFLSSPGGLAQAEADYRQKLTEDPTTLFAVKGLVTCLLQRGKAEEAAQVIRNVLDFLPDNAEFHYNLGVILLRIKQIDDAEYHLRTALRLGGYEEAAAWASLGSIALTRNNPQEAMRCLRKATRRAPENWRMHWQTSLIHEQLGDVEAAIRSMEEAIRLNANDPAAQQRLDSLKQKRGTQP